MARFPSIDEVMRQKTSRARRASNETYAAMALGAATIVAMVWANIGGSYAALWSTPAGFHVAGFSLELNLSNWIDEGLMTLFFFTVGLDVRREFSLGELRHLSRAALPVAAAIGGLIVPAGIFLLLSLGKDYASAWGSVISTDTAFAIGMLALVGPRNAPRLRVFLLTLAVVDDIGALTVIGVFYTDHLNLLAMGLAALGLLGIWLLQRGPYWVASWRAAPYAILGVFTWIAMYLSGVQPTLAGVLIALLMPVYPPHRRDVEYASVFFRLFRQAPAPDTARIARDAVVYAVPINQRLSEALTPYVNYVVVPLFALANAGVALSGDSLAAMLRPGLAWTVIAALVAGKLVGITVAAALVIRLLPASRLPGLDLPRLAGAGALSGMGFTISLLVVGIAIDDRDIADQARIGVLAASLIALGLAWLIFRLGDRFSPLPTPAGEVLQRKVDPARDHVRGPSDAPGTLVVYAAMDDAYRRATGEALKDVRGRLGSDLRVVFRHHAETDEAMTAALALEAAAAQCRFWDMHDALLRSPDPVDESSVFAVATKAGLDAEKLADRVHRNQDRSRVEDDNLDANAAGMPTTPVLFAQSKRVTASPTAWHLTQILRKDIEQDRS